MNYDHGFNVSEVCNGPAIQYAANIFVTTPLRSALRRSVMLDKKLPPTDDLRTYSEDTIRLLRQPERNRVIGIDYFKYCAARPHRTLQLERIGAIAFACYDNMEFDILPESLYTEGGVGKAKSSLPTHHLFDPVIEFTILPGQQDSHPVRKVAEAAVSRPGSRAYIALRGLEQVCTIR